MLCCKLKNDVERITTVLQVSETCCVKYIDISSTLYNMLQQFAARVVIRVTTCNETLLHDKLHENLATQDELSVYG